MAVMEAIVRNGFDAFRNGTRPRHWLTATNHRPAFHFCDAAALSIGRQPSAFFFLVQVQQRARIKTKKKEKKTTTSCDNRIGRATLPVSPAASINTPPVNWRWHR